MTKNDKYIDSILSELISFRRQIHKNPELSNHEIETSKLIYETLGENGIQAEFIKDGIGVTALIEGGGKGPTIAYRADIDALPVEEKSDLPFASQNAGACHACGHDIHTTVLLGAALVLQHIKDSLQGNVRIIFQSGEENFTGAKQALAYGALENVDCILALHTWPDLDAGTIGLKKGFMMASSSNVSFTITGKGGHAAHPHKAVDPVMVSAYTMTAVQSIIARSIAPIDSAVITFGKLTAGTASNVIPDTATAEGTVRTLDAATDKRIGEQLKQLVSNQAASFGAKGEVRYENICPPIINDEKIIDIVEASSNNSVGIENIAWLKTPSMGSEDFSYYLEKVPGALVRLGTGNDNEKSRLSLHNAQIIFDEKSIETGVRFMSEAIKELLENYK